MEHEGCAVRRGAVGRNVNPAQIYRSHVLQIIPHRPARLRFFSQVFGQVADVIIARRFTILGEDRAGERPAAQLSERLAGPRHPPPPPPEPDAEGNERVGGGPLADLDAVAGLGNRKAHAGARGVFRLIGVERDPHIVVSDELGPLGPRANLDAGPHGEAVSVRPDKVPAAFVLLPGPVAVKRPLQSGVHANDGAVVCVERVRHLSDATIMAGDMVQFELRRLQQQGDAMAESKPETKSEPEPEPETVAGPLRVTPAVLRRLERAAPDLLKDACMYDSNADTLRCLCRLGVKPESLRHLYPDLSLIIVRRQNPEFLRSFIEDWGATLSDFKHKMNGMMALNEVFSSSDVEKVRVLLELLDLTTEDVPWEEWRHDAIICGNVAALELLAEHASRGFAKPLPDEEARQLWPIVAEYRNEALEAAFSSLTQLKKGVAPLTWEELCKLEREYPVRSLLAQRVLRHKDDRIPISVARDAISLSQKPAAEKWWTLAPSRAVYAHSREGTYRFASEASSNPWSIERRLTYDELLDMFADFITSGKCWSIPDGADKWQLRYDECSN